MVSLTSPAASSTRRMSLSKPSFRCAANTMSMSGSVHDSERSRLLRLRVSGSVAARRSAKTCGRPSRTPRRWPCILHVSAAGQDCAGRGPARPTLPQPLRRYGRSVMPTDDAASDRRRSTDRDRSGRAPDIEAPRDCRRRGSPNGWPSWIGSPNARCTSTPRCIRACTPTCRPRLPTSMAPDRAIAERSPMPRRVHRLDAELVRRGLARSREHAVALIAAGRVEVRGVVGSKPASGVDLDTPVRVLPDDSDPDYASRGGFKLAGALAAFAGHHRRRAALPGRRRVHRRLHRRPAARRRPRGGRRRRRVRATGLAVAHR